VEFGIALRDTVYLSGLLAQCGAINGLIRENSAIHLLCEKHTTTIQARWMMDDNEVDTVFFYRVIYY